MKRSLPIIILLIITAMSLIYGYLQRTQAIRYEELSRQNEMEAQKQAELAAQNRVLAEENEHRAIVAQTLAEQHAIAMQEELDRCRKKK